MEQVGLHQRGIIKKNSEFQEIKEIEVGNDRYERDKRLHPKTYLTILGEVHLNRYCYQPIGRTPEYNGSINIHPVDIEANLSKDKYSYPLQEIAVLATNGESYLHGHKLIKKILGISLPIDSLERINKNSAQGYDDFYKDYKPIEISQDELTVLSFDGKGIPMTKEESVNIKPKNGKGEKKQKKKESLVATSYPVKPIKRLSSSVDKVFGKNNYIGILDIIHVRDYLYTAGYAFNKEGSPELRSWVYDKMLRILDGKVVEVVDDIKSVYEELDKTKQEKVKPLISYFTNNSSRMRYDVYLKNGYPIASGVVESACSQVVANRTELPGARWTIDGVEPILKHRSINTSEDWDGYWDYYKIWNKKKNYANNIEVVESLLENNRLCG